MDLFSASRPPQQVISFAPEISLVVLQLVPYPTLMNG